ncbi:unnamed protein product [Medioppia subpectinata]|uniref:Protein kinase domain-containing protein n=1 Tax=Medioppia subpectinata TaxID=1979941 RepID=A0A7R9Q6T4_9ACAR|nr:unnamed protein product [Medioppia subpectinata]CAG2113612.1 unnamed protein product [Medioppia subpectinata]
MLNNGCLGLGHNSPVLTQPPQIIQELCHKNIQYFVNGYYVMLAVNDVNNVFSWGSNGCGQLAQGHNQTDYFKPELIRCFTGKNIVQISCDYSHSLALTSNGRVYAWGNNYSGQIGDGDKSGFIYIPIEIQIAGNCKIQSVYCYNDSSFAITSDGHVFSWGQNCNHRLGHNIPEDKVLKPRLISTISRVVTLVYETKYNNLIGFYAKECQITNKTIDLRDINELTIITSNDIQMKSDNTVIVMSFEEFREILQPMASNSHTITPMGNNNGQSQVSQSNFYHNTFDELNRIGRGGFGEVFRVRHKLVGKVYAIKKVEFPADESDERQQRVLNEAKSLANLSSQYVVQYHNSWLEDNLLYIQMEYCPQSLRSVLADKALAFGRQSPTESMDAFEYFISCEIFKELLECVEYLHESVPRVIHRDLKPENILIANTLSGDNNNSRRFIKLCDFGLATVHDPNRHTASRYEHTTVGTRGYIAPEVYSGRYNQKADIFSLSVIGEELFDIYSSQSYEGYDCVLKACILCMSQILEKMMAHRRQRPECREVLAKHNEWSIDKTVVAKHKEFNSVLNTLKSNENPNILSIIASFNNVYYEINEYNTTYWGKFFLTVWL